MKKIFLLLLAISVLFLLNYFFNQSNTNKNLENSLFSDVIKSSRNFDYIKFTKDNNVTLVKKNKNWEIVEIGNYFSESKSVMSYLNKIIMSKVLDRYDVHDAKKNVLGFDDSNSALITLNNDLNSNKINLKIGNYNENLDYSYVLFEDVIYKLSGDIRFSDDSYYWAQKMVLDVGVDFITDISIDNLNSKFSFHNKNDVFYLKPSNIEINKDQVYSILNYFSDLYAEDIIYPKLKPNKKSKKINVSLYLIDGVIIKITIFQKDHLVYMNIDSVKKGHSLLFDSYMTRFTQDWTYVIPNLVFENLLISKKDLIK